MPESPTLVFPNINVQWDFSNGDIHNTTVLRTKRGRVQRIPEFPVAGIRRFTISTGFLDSAERNTFRTFFNAVRGGAISFYIYEPFPANYYSEPVGTVAGASTLLVPIKGYNPTVSDVPPLSVVTVAGVTKTFTVTEGVGSLGEARLNFSGSQTGATLLTGNFRKRYIALFEDDGNLENFIQDGLSFRSVSKLNIITLEQG